MKWTSTPPTEPGWYWLRLWVRDHFVPHPLLAEVYEYGSVWVAQEYDGEDVYNWYEVANVTGSQWCGPITPPEFE